MKSVAKAMPEQTSEEKMRYVNIKITEEAHSRAKIISVLKGITLNDYLAKAIDQEVEKDKGVLAKIK